MELCVLSDGLGTKFPARRTVYTAPYTLMMDRIRSEHVGMIFNLVYFKLLYNVDFNL